MNIAGYFGRMTRGSIIGVVDLQDVWTLKEYKERIGEPYNKESDKEFVFVFRNPRRLRIPFKMRGQPDIFEIDFGLVK